MLLRAQVEEQAKAAVDKTAVPNPDQVETQQWSPEEINDFAPPWSPLHPLKLTPPTPSTPGPGILKTSSDITMATQLDGESQNEEIPEEEEAAFDPCVFPEHDEKVIPIESDDECLMSPSKKTEKNEDGGEQNKDQHGPMDGEQLKEDEEVPADPQKKQDADEPGEEMDGIQSGDETAGNAKGTFQVRVGWAVLTMTRNIFEHVYSTFDQCGMAHTSYESVSCYNRKRVMQASNFKVLRACAHMWLQGMLHVFPKLGTM